MCQMILAPVTAVPVDAPLQLVRVATKSSHVAWGDMPAWLEAIGTTLVLFVAFAVFALDLRERRRKQASQVAAWFERHDADATLHVANSSDAPIYNVRVEPKLLGQVAATIRYPVLGPSADETELTIPMPGSRQVSNRFFNVEIYFSDGAGRLWRRKADGKLKRKYRKYN
jgi:hypothetical protein